MILMQLHTTNLHTGRIISWSTSPRYNPASLSAVSMLLRAANLFIPCAINITLSL